MLLLGLALLAVAFPTHERQSGFELREYRVPAGSQLVVVRR